MEGLPPGTYTVQAEQRDDVGNLGLSEAVTFTVLAPPAPVVPTPTPAAAPAPAAPGPSAPVASFQWFPSAPQVGEAVSLVSTSVDPSSAITAVAWSLSGNGVFTEGAPSMATTFATAGNHLVQLRVTDANGLSAMASESIAVSPIALTLMQPFPIVHMAGSYTSSGIKVSLLSVQAPVGATVTVLCRGSSCPLASQSVLASVGRSNSRAGSVLVTFRRFEHPLLAGTILEIKVFQHGHIGKLTRFVVRHGKPPSRSDTCVGPSGVTATACVST